VVPSFSFWLKVGVELSILGSDGSHDINMDAEDGLRHWRASLGHLNGQRIADAVSEGKKS
jgi:hypothetical protein